MRHRLGLAVIGCGMAATPHALALRDLAECIDVRGVWSRDPVRRSAFGAEHGFPVAESIEALLEDPSVEAALILTPPSARAEFVGAFAVSGRHILMEKPVERSTAAAAALVEQCEAADVTLGIVFQHRLRAASQQLAALVASGETGELQIVQASIPWWREQSYYDHPGRGTLAHDGGGVLITQAIHTLDLKLSLSGPVAAVQAIAGTTGHHRMECEDVVAAGLQFACGAVGSLMATTADFPGDAESLVFGFERVSAHLQAGSLKLYWRDGREETFGEAGGTGGGAEPMAFSHAWHRDLIADFVSAVQGRRPPACTGREALAVHHLIDALLLSAREGRRIAPECRP